MKASFLRLLLAAGLVAGVFTGCEKDSETGSSGGNSGGDGGSGGGNGGGVQIESVTIDPSSITLNAGSSHQMKAVVTPPLGGGQSLQVSWNVKDEAIATVSSTGLLRGVSEGVTELTASVGGKTGVCAVTVRKKPEVHVKLTRTQPAFQKITKWYPSDKFDMYNASVSPGSGYTDELVWTSSDESVAKIGLRSDGEGFTSCMVHYVGPGETTIKVSGAESSVDWLVEVHQDPEE